MLNVLVLPHAVDEGCPLHRFFRRLAERVSDSMEPIAAAMDLLEQVYAFLVQSRTMNLSFKRSLLKERRHARAFLSDVYCDGWNIVSTAQLLAYTVLPRPLGTNASAWPQEFRMRLCACLLVAAKWKKGDSVAGLGGNALLRAACCFMPQLEQDAIKANAHEAVRVRSLVMAAEMELLANHFSMSVGEGVLSAVELDLAEVFARGFLDARETAVARNLAVFQLRAVVRRDPEAMHECLLSSGLIYNSLRWMDCTPDTVGPGVEEFAGRVLRAVRACEWETLWKGLFADPTGHTGRYLAVSVEDLTAPQ